MTLYLQNTNIKKKSMNMRGSLDNFHILTF